MSSIWSDHAQRFHVPGFAMIAIMNKKARAEEFANATVADISRQQFNKRVSKSEMGDRFDYAILEGDVETFVDNITLRLALAVDVNHPVHAWLREEFPNHIVKPGHSPDFKLITLEDADMIRFRFMFPYMK